MLQRAACLVLCLCTAVPALAVTWPQEITADEGTIVVYQPQPDKLEGNTLTGRAAMSIRVNDSDEPIFGAFWFESKIDTDQDAGTAIIRDVKVTNVRWPDSRDAEEQRFTAIVNDAMPNSGFEISLDRLSASLESAELARESLEGLRNDPPVIVFRETLAVLLIYDGKPKYADIDNSPYERVMNTPFAVVRRKGKDEYWLTSGTFWYRAGDPMGPWSASESPPSDLVKMMPKPDSDVPAPASAPEIVAASVPTELIVTQGEPSWQTLPGEGEILYVKNTETPWLRHLPTNNMYVLLSGRWFRSKSQDGPWTFVRPDELPASFQDIPPESDIGALRASVAGTQEAEDAVLDAQIPQTAAIKRSEAKLTVEYDGEPKFEAIPKTSVSYAVNTASQVLLIDNVYYAVDNGVWFVASAAEGPWRVADEIPQDEIDKIPPSSPVYNTTYVHVYESTPEIVYVGYTPGYMWSYPYYGVPVYGTGWYYPPYYGPHYYYPRPPTWGLHVGYNPWTGWNVGLSWSSGFFTFGIGWSQGYPGGYHPGYCCGGGYRPPVFINNGDINIGNEINIGDRNRVDHRAARDTGINTNDARNNVYNRPENRARNADRATAAQNLRQAKPATSQANNVFTDRNGNVARHTGNGWESLQGGQWSRDNASVGSYDRARNTAGQRQASPGTRNYDWSGLDRSNAARQHGMSREMSRPSMRRPTRRR